MEYMTAVLCAKKTTTTFNMPTSYQQSVGVGKRGAHIIWSMVTSAKAALVRNYIVVYWPCAGGFSAVNAMGTQ